MLKGEGSKKGLVAETISSGDYLGNNRESIEDMLAYIKLKVDANELVAPSPVPVLTTVPARSVKSISK